MPKHNIPIQYLFLYRRIKETAKHRRFIPWEEYISVLKRTLFRYKHCYYKQITKEMCDYGLIHRVNKHLIEITGANSHFILKKYDREL